MAAPRLSIVLVAVLATPFAWALPAPGVLDDAGSGQDAGDSPSSAMAVGYGSYGGNLTPGDIDWFSFPSATAPACMDVSVLTGHAMRVGLQTGTGGSLVGGLTDGLFATTLAVEPSSLALGILPDEDPWDKASVGPYLFDVLVAVPAARGDTRQNDAPTQLNRSLPAPASCFRGVFHGSVSEGDTDVWSFTGERGHRIVYSFAAETRLASGLAVLTQDGTPLGPSVKTGELAEAVLPYNGTYYLRAHGFAPSSAENYTVAFVTGPEPTGCRPYCFRAE